ncbi:hypothetical protein PHAVU_002G169900 [Phaseolus vulgaris]|uniref:Uncharacterized protein n=1 Tax=Phaseolus vulgaris TaxID=3885 RepID=V7CN24_PHAVU|nr:hypothetical protein PHAVU_002G169900g [Phaseolus vulgaris]ESW30635.1 hypothetical protein PHAVU_002G169900g [Phaseolus vulgaris]
MLSMGHSIIFILSLAIILVGDECVEAWGKVIPLAVLKAEIKSEKRQISHLKKKSLWARSLEEIWVLEHALLSNTLDYVFEKKMEAMLVLKTCHIINPKPRQTFAATSCYVNVFQLCVKGASRLL